MNNREMFRVLSAAQDLLVSFRLDKDSPYSKGISDAYNSLSMVLFRLHNDLSDGASD